MDVDEQPVRHDPARPLAGRTALVTGGARGLGRTYCEVLAAAGASVVTGDLAPCDATVAAITSAGGRAMGVRLDITAVESCRQCVAVATTEFGRLDVVVNNAALYATLRTAPFETITEDEWNTTLAVNVTGVWNMCRAAVPALKAAGGGSIINISSLAAVYGMANALHYTATKAAVLGISRGLARELGRYSIRVNSIAPSAVDTEGTAEFFGDRRDRALDVIVSQQSIRRTLEPDDVAGAVLFLASDASKFITGQTLMVDGGTVST